MTQRMTLDSGWAIPRGSPTDLGDTVFISQRHDTQPPSPSPSGRSGSVMLFFGQKSFLEENPPHFPLAK